MVPTVVAYCLIPKKLFLSSERLENFVSNFYDRFNAKLDDSIRVLNYGFSDLDSEVDEERFYVVDFFAVRGGHQHDQSWHGMYVEPETPDLDWQTQADGTLAFSDLRIPFAGRWHFAIDVLIDDFTTVRFEERIAFETDTGQGRQNVGPRSVAEYGRVE